MKVKQHPDDFVVNEKTHVVPDQAGAFAFYRLEKTGWTTPDALSVVRRRWNIVPQRLSYGGLKDRHAQTTQHFTIWRGPQRQLSQKGIRVEYLGQIEQPFDSRDIAANGFRLTLRNLSDEQSATAIQALPELKDYGVPNYFDDQRFGSVGGENDFVAKHMVLGNFETALKTALTAPYAFDRAEQKKEKAILREHWGDWPRCKEQLPRSHARSLTDYLVSHPADFRGAIARMRPELRGLYLSAYQSHLWNRMLALWLRETIPADRLVEVGLRLGDLPMHRGLTAEQIDMLRDTQLPLPTARQRWNDLDPRRQVYDQALQEDGISQDQLKIRGLRDLFFSKGERAVLNLPRDLTWEFADDDAHAGRKKLILSFELNRGSYATLLIKRLGGDR
ncbi:MAG: tRNA pseudouridine(13) synthase TruD [Gemmataceae bacterium]|nr:tRNA pseudouridine(13) synthase TruD [Gemmataceae bacterium]